MTSSKYNPDHICTHFGSHVIKLFCRKLFSEELEQINKHPCKTTSVLDLLRMLYKDPFFFYLIFSTKLLF